MISCSICWIWGLEELLMNFICFQIDFVKLLDLLSDFKKLLLCILDHVLHWFIFFESLCVKVLTDLLWFNTITICTRLIKVFIACSLVVVHTSVCDNSSTFIRVFRLITLVDRCLELDIGVLKINYGVWTQPLLITGENLLKDMPSYSSPENNSVQFTVAI